VTTIALEQLRSKVGNASGSFDRIVGLARGAFAQGTGIAVFPELAVSGYTTDETVLRSVAAPVYGPAIAQVAEVAREHDGLVVLPRGASARHCAPSTSSADGEDRGRRGLPVPDHGVLRRRLRGGGGPR
jgi:predicted amidohydrolase